VAREPTEVLEFARDEPAEVLSRMVSMAAEHRGWINLRPRVHQEAEDGDAPVPGAGLFGVFGGAGPPVPLCTWTPGEQRRRGVGPASLGVQHAVGPKVVRWLAEFGVPVPDGWVVAQDHPKRGLVVHPAPEVGPEEALEWLLRVGDAVCRLPLTGRWVAAVYG
jgi:hypothetical protein